MFSPPHFMLYRGKLITFGTVYRAIKTLFVNCFEYTNIFEHIEHHKVGQEAYPKYSESVLNLFYDFENICIAMINVDKLLRTLKLAGNTYIYYI